VPHVSRRAFMGSSAGALLAGRAGAQHTALDTVRLVVGSASGDTADLVCRPIADTLRGIGYATLARIENRAGAEGRTAIASFKGAPTDGSALLGTSASTLTLYPHIDKKPNYDVLDDLTAITMACTSDFALAVGPAIPTSVKTVPDFLAWCDGDPNQANFGSPATGSLPHLIGALLGKSAGVSLWHVPYRGIRPAIGDLIAGRIQAVCGPLGEFLPLAYAGQVNLLGVSGPTRSRFALGIPTFAEQGLVDMVFREWFGFFAPGDTPTSAALHANEALRTAITRKKVTDALAALGLEARTSTPSELAIRLRADYDRMGSLVRKVGFTVEN
jgi:tripartite-type tricarboxylate transporter receptor subunit TctC